MSSPDEQAGREERQLTIIVVPHGDLETRSFVISYARLKILMIAIVGLALVMAVSLAILFPVVIQAANAGELKRELEELEEQRAEMAELARVLQQVEEQYEKVRQMLGADAAISGDSTLMLPPLRGDSAPEPPRSSVQPLTRDDIASIGELVDLWPLQVPGFITRTLSDGRSQHTGVDIAVPLNTRIRAAGGGTVETAGVDDVYGQYIILDHGERVQTVYGHASRLMVTAGDRVGRGDLIALSGSTGRSTAPHLHFEVRFEGNVVDPLKLVRQP